MVYQAFSHQIADYAVREQKYVFEVNLPASSIEPKRF